MVESRIDNNTSVYAVLTVVSGSDYVSELHITANLSSSVTCIATDYNEQNDTIHLRVLGVLPKHTVAIQIRDMRYERLCFIPIMWRNTATSVKAQVTHYTLYVNGNFISNKTANLSSTAHYSQFLATDECANHHIVDISATNICGMTGQSIIYRTQRQDQGCPTHTDTTSCTATEIPTLPATIIPVTRPVGGTRPSGYSERNHGNVLLIIASGIMVVTTCLMGSL